MSYSKEVRYFLITVCECYKPSYGGLFSVQAVAQADGENSSFAR